RQLPDGLDGLRPGAEARRRGGLAEVQAAGEADLRIEVLADVQERGVEAVAVAGIVDPRLEAPVVSREPGRLGACIVGASLQIREEREGGVDAVGAVGSPAR